MATAADSFPPEDPRPLKVFFQDEGRFGRICEPVGAWAPRGCRPIVGAQIIRQYTHVYSAICPSDGESFSLILPYSDTQSMKIFLEEFTNAFCDYRLVLILDGAGWHKSVLLRDFPNVRLIFLPPYSPELNPVEHFWDHLREKYFRNRLWPSLEKLEDHLEKALRNVIQSKELLHKLCGFAWAIV